MSKIIEFFIGPGTYKRSKILFLLILPFCIGSYAGTKIDPSEQLGKAISAYKSKEYEKSLELFEELNKENRSAGLFFNIGNCYMKMSKIGHAIAAYNSALMRDPMNPDIRHNLTFARSLVKDEFLFEEKEGISLVYLNLLKHFSLKMHQVVFYILFSLLLTFVFMARFKKFSLKRIKIALFLGVVVLGIQGGNIYLRFVDVSEQKGVVAVPELHVRYGPGITETEAFVLHEGAVFKIHSQFQNWLQIKLPGGKVGWVPSEKCVLIL